MSNAMDLPNCELCGAMCAYAPGIDIYCPNPECHEPATLLPKPQVWVTWVEPWWCDGRLPLHCAVKAEDVINLMRRKHPEYKDIEDADVLKDFAAVHWATITQSRWLTTWTDYRPGELTGTPRKSEEVL